jgi:excisionase family DNA binding protein
MQAELRPFDCQRVVIITSTPAPIPSATGISSPGGSDLETNKVWFRASEAAKYLGISLPTLKKIEREGKLVPFRTPGGHRRYTLEMLNEYLESAQEPPPEKEG